jgi:hypothetical protein
MLDVGARIAALVLDAALMRQASTAASVARPAVHGRER